MARKLKYRYTFMVFTRWRSVRDNHEEDSYSFSFIMEGFGIYEAKRMAEMTVKKDCSTSYTFRFQLISVEEV